MSHDVGVEQAKQFQASDEGRQFLERIRGHLKGHTIDEVQFIANGEGFTTVLHLDNGQCYAFNDEELHLETLREQLSGLFRELTRHDTLNRRKGDEHHE